MPVQVSYPGVYVEEISGGQPVVAGVSTSSTAFVDFFSRGPMEKPIRVTDMESVQRIFGGLDSRSEASYGLRQYFLNGGQEAWVIRTARAGTAIAASRDVKVMTPGLEARFTAASNDFQLAEAAAAAAKQAAADAADALAKLATELTQQQEEQETGVLRDKSSEAARETSRTADLARDAAVQAQASSDELAIAIAAAKAASGPVADRTVEAAQFSAAGAAGSRDAAQATKEVTNVAVVAADLASKALKAGQKARTAHAMASDLEALLQAVEAAGAANKTVGEQKNATDGATSDTAAQQAAISASQAAQALTEQAMTAAQQALAVSQQLARSQAADGADASGGDGAGSGSSNAPDPAAAQALVDAAKAAGREARRAAFAATTADTLDEAKAAVAQVDAAAQAAMTVVDGSGQAAAAGGSGDQSGSGGQASTNALQVAKDAMPMVLAAAAAAANEAADLASPVPATGDPAGGGGQAGGGDQQGSGEPTVDPVATSVAAGAVQSIDTAVDAALDSVLAAKNGAAAAKEAAAAVGSAGPTLAARGAEASADAAEDTTTKALANADSVKQQIAKASKTADAAAPVARAAATAAAPSSSGSGGSGGAQAAGSELTDLNGQAKKALAAAQAGSNAADGALATATTVESTAVIVARVAEQAAASSDIAAEAAEAAVAANREASMKPILTVAAINPGVWGDNLEVEIVTVGAAFSLTVKEYVTQGGVTRQLSVESYPTLTLDWESPANALEVVNDASKLLHLSYTGPKVEGAYPEAFRDMLSGGNDGQLATPDELVSAMMKLDTIEPSIFNILCLPAASNMTDAEAKVAYSAAEAYVGKKRAFLIVDIPDRIDTPDAMLAWSGAYRSATAIAMASYFPRLVIADPLAGYRPRNIPASGTLAGIYARTDTNVGVWKAPAGVTATIEGADVAVAINDDQNGQLNPLGINVLRSFPIYGNIAWGARTLAGADQISSEYKYIPVRRLMSYIEESIFQSMKWAVFEPNNEVLWSKIRVQIGGFLAGLFADGAFQGATPASAFFVRVDGTTTTPLDIELGRVNVQIGVAPVKPAEFIILEFQQIVGQAAA